MGSLASSPLVPFVTAGLAGALIIGTSYGGNSEDANAADDAADAVAAEEATATAAQVEKDFAAEQGAAAAAAAPTDVAAATAPAKATAKCSAASCVVTFPKAGGTATVFGKPMVMKAGFPAGLSYTFAGVAGSASTKKVGKAGAYKVTVTKADANGYTLTVAK